MSLYEPLLMFKEEELPAEAEADDCPSSSLSHQQPEEVSSSSNATVSEQSSLIPPQQRINTTSGNENIAKKRRTITPVLTAAAAAATTQIDPQTKIHYIDNGSDSTAENIVQSESSSTMNEQVGHFLKNILDCDHDDDRTTIDKIDNSDGLINNDVSFDSSGDDEAIIERIKLATKKKKQMNEKRHSEATATSTAARSSIDIETNNNCSPIRRIRKMDKQNARWMGMYQRLVAFKKEHKHTGVPRHYTECPQLGTWVNEQRFSYKANTILAERKHMLDSIGFVSGSTAAWEKMYHRLVAYKKKHKHIKVHNIAYYEKDIQLGYWVGTQQTA